MRIHLLATVRRHTSSASGGTQKVASWHSTPYCVCVSFSHEEQTTLASLFFVSPCHRSIDRSLHVVLHDCREVCRGSLLQPLCSLPLLYYCTINPHSSIKMKTVFNTFFLVAILAVLSSSFVFMLLTPTSFTRRRQCRLSMIAVDLPSPPSHTIINTPAHLTSFHTITTSSVLPQNMEQWLSIQTAPTATTASATESSTTLLSIQEYHKPTPEELAAKKRNFNLWFWGGGIIAPFLATFYYFGLKFWER